MSFNRCIIKSSNKIKREIKTRFEELGLKYSKVINDAKNKGKPIQKAALSRYMLSDTQSKGSLDQETILWLCTRYGIEIKVRVQSKKFNNKKCIKKINDYF